MKDLLRGAVGELSELLRQVTALEPALGRLGEACMACWESEGKLLIAGNGGSAADAMHLAEELVVRFKKNRRALGAIALTDATILTCCANDYSFEQVFERQVEALGRAGDILLVMSSSGNSENLIRALNAAKARGMTTASMLGRGGGKAKGLAEIELIVPSDSTARVQEVHALLFHVLCDWIDARVD